MDFSFLFTIDLVLVYDFVMVALEDRLPGANRKYGYITVGNNVIGVDTRWETTRYDYAYFDGKSWRYRFECVVFPADDSVTLQEQIGLVRALHSIFNGYGALTQVICDTELEQALGL